MRLDSIILTLLIVLTVYAFMRWEARRTDDTPPTSTHYHPPRGGRSPSLSPVSPKKRRFQTYLTKKREHFGEGESHRPLLQRKKPDLPKRRSGGSEGGRGGGYFG